MKPLALELLSQYDTHISATLIFNRIQEPYNRFIAVSLFTGLHCASYFGINEVVEALIEAKGCDINQGDRTGFTPLMQASLSGHEGVVRLLLSSDDVDPKNQTSGGPTPLTLASMHGNEGVASPDQCSQPYGAPVGPGGGTAMSPGRDGTAKRSPSSSLNFQDGRH